MRKSSHPTRIAGQIWFTRYFPLLKFSAIIHTRSIILHIPQQIYYGFSFNTSRSQKLRSRSNSLTKSQWLNGYSILLFSSNQLGLESSKAFRSAMTRIHLPRRYVSSLRSLPDDDVWYDIYWVLLIFCNPVLYIIVIIQVNFLISNMNWRPGYGRIRV